MTHTSVVQFFLGSCFLDRVDAFLWIWSASANFNSTNYKEWPKQTNESNNTYDCAMYKLLSADINPCSNRI